MILRVTGTLEGEKQHPERVDRFWADFGRLVERYGWTWCPVRQALVELPEAPILLVANDKPKRGWIGR